jgi:hypothetical protein
MSTPRLPDFIISARFEPALQCHRGTIEHPLWRLLWRHTRGLRSRLLPMVPMGLRGRLFDVTSRLPVRKGSSEPLDPALRARLTETYREDILALGWQTARVRMLLHDGLSAMLAAAALALIVNGSLVLYLSLFPDRGDGGQLAVVLQALSPLLLVPKSLAVSTLPGLGRQVVAGSADAARTTTMLLRLTLLVSAAVALLGTVLAPPLTGLLLGADYARAGAWFGPALWLLLPFGAGQLLTQLLFARGDVWPNAARAWAGALVTLLALWPLARWLGGAGVLVAMGLGLAVWTLALARLAYRHGDLGPEPGLAATTEARGRWRQDRGCCRR